MIADYHTIVDGTLEQDTSNVNELSVFSYKARTRGCSEVSVMYAYDIELMEPMCVEIFLGNSIDASSYLAFIRSNVIQKGNIDTDKGFPYRKIKEGLSDHIRIF